MTKNPRLKRITFHIFKHWKGTMEYHRTKDILHVQQVLGHKDIQNTLRYITLADELFKGQQEYVSKVAKNVKDACVLVDAGFEYSARSLGHIKTGWGFPSLVMNGDVSRR